MSYNIDRWITKKLDNLIIPLAALYDESIREGWKPDKPVIESTDNGIKVSIYLCEDGEIEGELLPDNMLAVTRIKVRGESSGNIFYEVVEPALRKSTGKLEAVLIWESGDSISRLKVLDGVVTQEQVEL